MAMFGSVLVLVLDDCLRIVFFILRVKYPDVWIGVCFPPKLTCTGFCPVSTRVPDVWIGSCIGILEYRDRSKHRSFFQIVNMFGAFCSSKHSRRGRGGTLGGTTMMWSRN